MNSARLKQIREERGWSLREMAEFLRDVDGSTLSRWERNPAAEIPSWISERLLSSVPITLPLEELEEMLEFARTQGLNFSGLLAAAIREYLAEHPAGKDIDALFDESTAPPPKPYLLDSAAEADKPSSRAADEEPPVP